MQNIKFNNVDEYISSLPPKSRSMMMELRDIIKQAAPAEAEEVISYNMPAFRYYGILVYYAAHKEHIGFYPGGSIFNEVFKIDLTGYKTSKGTIQFPMEEPLPEDLIKRIVKYRVEQNLEKMKNKKKK